MDNVGDFIASVSLGYHGLAFHLTALALPAQSSYIWHGDFLMSVRIFSPFDGWLTVDGLRYTSFYDINLNAWKLFHSERLTFLMITTRRFFGVLKGDQGTLLNGAKYLDFDVKCFSLQTTFSVRSAMIFLLFFCVLRGTQRTLTGCPTAGAQVLAKASTILWHPYHFGPALLFF